MNKTTTLVSKVRHVKKSTEPCLYTLLNLPARGTPENLQLTANDIRRAYRLAALDFHPDKNPTEEAAQAFLLIGDAYRILSDPEKKREYDRTGRLDLGTLGREATTRSEDWMEVFRNMFDEVSSEEVADFYSTYIGSEDEVEDTLRAYELCKGDFVAMVTHYCMFPNEPGHVERLHEICKNLIKTKKVKENAAFRTSTLTESLQRIEEYLNRERVLAEAEAEARKFQQTASASRKKRGSGLKDAGALTLFSDQNKFESFLDALSTKYENLDASKKRTSRKRKDNQS